jgi:hypothetical protein
MAIAGGAMGCYTMRLKNGALDVQRSTGNKDTITSDPAAAAAAIIEGKTVDVLAHFPTMQEVRSLVMAAMWNL